MMALVTLPQNLVHQTFKFPVHYVPALLLAFRHARDIIIDLIH